ncbi:hypothetical protein BU23DRAFT_565360 [Bimuria novae-zelandiae CBS 107.79]|uniref:Uncharacterized protein n=1 Tax=Bimuria novae-zelandiae CBS 107.79 TaxID=1447943 RepID=A0A6A5VJQ5_9PLEO|nr:hypothetical protein BU23DRAFT_565360 [Bimuria novae-zelandiae CBS 107.79]
MHFLSILAVPVMVVLSVAASQGKISLASDDMMPRPPAARGWCPKEPHCVLITYDSMKQVELDNTSCTNLKDDHVNGVLVASCTCYLFSNFDCTDNFDKLSQCPGLKSNFKKTVRSIRCEGQ